MEPAVQLFMDYSSAFEETYLDDDWSRLTPFFKQDARYEVRGGPMAFEIQGREAILKGLKRSIDGFDRRCDERALEITGGPHVRAVPGGQEVSIEWLVNYRRGESPVVCLRGRTAITVADGRITAMRDEHDDDAQAQVAAWLQRYGVDLDRSYV